MTKDTTFSGATMTVKGSHEPVQVRDFMDSLPCAVHVLRLCIVFAKSVTGFPSRIAQTASAEMTLVDGVLTQRGGCESGSCSAIQTAVKSEAMPLSSQMMVENLGELKSVKIEQGESFVIFQVLAVGRYKQLQSRHGTVLVLYTHLGEGK